MDNAGLVHNSIINGTHGKIVIDNSCELDLIVLIINLKNRDSIYKYFI